MADHQQLSLNYNRNISSMTIIQLKHWVKSQQYIKNSFIEELKKDSRKTTTKLANKCIRKNKKLKKEKERIQSLKKIEKDLHNKGYDYIAGVDEAGKGALAGPVTAAAVILPEDVNLLNINDSKKLTTEKRENLYSKIIDKALAVGIGMVSVYEINEMGIATANRLAMKKSLDNLTLTPDFVLIDSIEINGLGYSSMSVPKGDSQCYCIAAASIIAKVTRDRKIVILSEEYSEYWLEDNKGYGTSGHQKAVEEYGYSDIHRKNFKFNHIGGQKLGFK